jgi:hypothetical protein
MYMYMPSYHLADGYAARSGDDVEKLSFAPRSGATVQIRWFCPVPIQHRPPAKTWLVGGAEP